MSYYIGDKASHYARPDIVRHDFFILGKLLALSIIYKLPDW